MEYWDVALSDAFQPEVKGSTEGNVVHVVQAGNPDADLENFH